MSPDHDGYVADHGAYGVASYETDIASRYGGHPAAGAPEVGDRPIGAALRAVGAVASTGKSKPFWANSGV